MPVSAGAIAAAPAAAIEYAGGRVPLRGRAAKKIAVRA